VSVSCEGATVTGNQIVDTSDVAIVLYRTTQSPQHSVVRGNYVLSAGNSMYGGLALEPAAPQARRSATGRTTSPAPPSPTTMSGRARTPAS
jgi:hypothetical protein